MTTEEKLLITWRSLPQDKQQEVIDFVEFLELRLSQDNSVKDKVTSENDVPEFKTPLAQKLWALRQQGIATGEVKLLNWEEIEKEVQERRGVRDWND